jgi:ABC-type branched-subunit amino acid transport system ATPase component
VSAAVTATGVGKRYGSLVALADLSFEAQHSEILGVLGPNGAGKTTAISIADRRTLDSGGILPLALGVPALLGALTLGVRLVRRRERRVAVTRAEA